MHCYNFSLTQTFIEILLVVHKMVIIRKQAFLVLNEGVSQYDRNQVKKYQLFSYMYGRLFSWNIILFYFLCMLNINHTEIIITFTVCKGEETFAQFFCFSPRLTFGLERIQPDWIYQG